MPRFPPLSGCPAARRSRWFSGRRLSSDQSNPKVLTVAVGLSPRISYWTFTDVRRPLRPGASVAAVCPPAFRVPRLVSVASLRLSHPRTTLVIFTSAPSTESFTCLTSFSHRPPSVLISTLGLVELIVCSPSQTTRQQLWRCPQAPVGRRTRRQRKTLPDFGSSYFFTPFFHDYECLPVGTIVGPWS